MEKRTLRKISFERLFIISTIFTIGIGWYALILTELQIFYRSLLLTGIFIIIGIYLFIIFRKHYRLEPLSRLDIITLIVIFVVALSSAIFAHNNFSGGRDNGVLANSSVYLVKNHSLINKESINFPGWISKYSTNTNEVTHEKTENYYQPGFQFGYISWLATHYAVFGINGIKMANIIPILIGLLSLYFIGKKIGNRKVGLITVLFFSTLYPFIWFSRQTMTEIFSFCLLWFIILCLLRAYQYKRGKYLIYSIITFGLFFHVRLEAIAIFAVFLFVLGISYFIFKQKWISIKSTIGIVILVLMAFALYTIFIQPTYLYNTVSSATKISSSMMNKIFKITDQGTLQSTINSMVLSDSDRSLDNNMTEFMFQISSRYGFTPLLTITLITILCLIMNPKTRSNKYLVIIFFIISPTLIYLIRPYVSLDQPWMLRRQLFSVLPFLCLFSSLFILKFLKKKIVILTTSLFLLTNLSISSPILFLKENEGTLQSINSISEKTTKNDLILVEEFAMDGFKPADPLYFLFDRRTFWMTRDSQLYNISNRTKRSTIDYKTFPHIYILGNINMLQIFHELPVDSFELIASESFAYKRLKQTCVLDKYIKRKDIWKLDYDLALRDCIVPKEIMDNQGNLQLYKIKNNFKKYLDRRLYFSQSWNFQDDNLVAPQNTFANLYVVIDPLNVSISSELSKNLFVSVTANQNTDLHLYAFNQELFDKIQEEKEILKLQEESIIEDKNNETIIDKDENRDLLENIQEGFAEINMVSQKENTYSYKIENKYIIDGKFKLAIESPNSDIVIYDITYELKNNL